MILLVQGCILAAARENARIVPHPAGRMEGGLRGKKAEKERKKAASVSPSTPKEGRAEGGKGRLTCGSGLLVSRKKKT